MVTGPPPQGNFSGASALLAHLRQHPEDFRRSPAELAAKFSLSESFVRSVLDRTKIPNVKVRKLGPTTKERIRGAGKSFLGFLDRLTRRPMMACFIIIGLWIAVIVGTQLAIPQSATGRILTSMGAMQAPTLEPALRRANITKPTAAEAAGELKLAVQFSADLVGMLMLFGVFFRHGKSRYAGYAGLTIFLVISIGYMPGVLSESRIGSGRLTAFALFEFALFFIVGIFVGLGSLAAVLGGYLNMRQAARQRLRQSRHQLLSHYFQIEQRLKAAVAMYFPQPPNPLVVSLQNRATLWATGLGFATSFITLSAMHFGKVPLNQGATPPAWFIVFGFFSSCATLFMFVGICFLAGKPLRSALTAFCWTLGSTAALLLPWLRVPGALTTVQNIEAQIFSCVFYTTIGLIIGAGALVQRQASRDKLLARNDPATLMAELLEVQYALSEGQTQVCVMVVDAAKSAAMKATADPLVVEFSFRAYQAWLARVCIKHNGRIYTVTGDGAIAAFATCGEALQAGLDIQADVARFNQEENRLSHPFRLRIGLHAGDVVADLEKVEFTDVIDIAAHVEGASPIGCVTVTDVVSAQLAGYHFDPLTKAVDGHRVFVGRGAAKT